MTTRRVAWRRSDEVATDEHCTLTVRDGGLSLVGTVLGAEGGQPVRIEYRVLADGAGMTTAVSRARPARLRAADARARTRPEGLLERRRQGRAGAQGLHRRRPRLQPVDKHAADPAAAARDRRHQEDPGRLGPLPRTHRGQGGPDVHPPRRIHATTTRAATFEADLTVDDDGLVTSYADWQRSGWAIGPDAPEPLDAIR